MPRVVTVHTVHTVLAITVQTTQLFLLPRFVLSHTQLCCESQLLRTPESLLSCDRPRRTARAQFRVNNLHTDKRDKSARNTVLSSAAQLFTLHLCMCKPELRVTVRIPLVQNSGTAHKCTAEQKRKKGEKNQGASQPRRLSG